MGRRAPKALTKVKKKGTSWKQARIDVIRHAAEQYPQAFVLSFANQRNALIKDLREHLKPGRLFYGNNKLVSFAIGTSKETEVVDEIYRVTEMLKGERGVLFTEASREELESVFAGLRQEQHARTGEIASYTVVLEEGTAALSSFPHSMEPLLRSLGLPTLLKDGVIILMGTHTICTEGKPLSAAAAQLLKLLDVKMSHFVVKIEAHWRIGEFINFGQQDDGCMSL